MQFKNPEILYFLFFLIIPILIHLFQLQKFQKVAFTNVRLLKEIKQQTRKSSQLKKILILLSRLFLFISLIFAFAQPFFNNEKRPINKETFIYIDNSFSMQAKGKSGEILQMIKTDLIKNLSKKESNITVITNNQVYKNLNTTALKNDILKIDYHPIKKELQSVLLQIQNLQNRKNKARNNILLISDFQNINKMSNEMNFDSLTNYSIVQTLPNNFENIAIDSVWIKDQNKESIKIKAVIKSHQFAIKNLSVSLFLGDRLFGKTTVDVNNNSQAEIEFSIPNQKSIQGKLSLNDNKLEFDNKLYFNIKDNERTKVLAIGEKSNFLSKIYTDDDFIFTSTSLRNLDYSAISKQEVIVLNELKKFTIPLIKTLHNFIANEGNIVLIPSLESDITSYNKLFSDLDLGKIKKLKHDKKVVTTINYSHPFFKNVFQKQISNFQYPMVQSFFETNLKTATPLLQFDDKSNFISEIKLTNSKFYWIAAPLNSNNTNFISSPLVVPVFYNFSLKKNVQKQLFYTIGHKNEITQNTNTQNDGVVHLVKKGTDFIPLQRKTSNYITIKTDIYPLTDGIYQVKSNGNVIQNIAYNYSRDESNLVYYPIDKFVGKNKNITYFNTTNNAIKQINDQYKNQNLWQLFIIFALMFLGIEIILQKFLKN